MPGKKIVVTGATGNVGTSVVEALSADEGVDEIVGVARRLPDWRVPKATWVAADVYRDELQGLFRGADAVVHLAWLFQPTHDPVTTWNSNVVGSARVFDAAVTAGVPALVYNSSVGAYSPGPKDGAVDESWPTHGWADAAYTREKAYVERLLDIVELQAPGTRVVRMRPGFIFKRASAGQQRRLFGGPLIPQRLIRPELIPAVPDIPGLKMQVLHTSDVARAIATAAVGTGRGAYNLASDPALDPALLADCLGARLVPVPLPVVRTALALAWWSHLIPATRGLFDAVLHLPIMDTGRARRELGWEPRVSARDAFSEVLEGMRTKAGMPTAPLGADAPGGRGQELATGVGQRP